jgi:hypothetical protein
MLKCYLLFIFVGLCTIVNCAAQHPVEGAWEMVSIKGVGADGERFSFDTTSIREVKIITATHYMLIAHDVVDDSLIFNRTYVGKIKIEGNTYLEMPMYSSLPIFENVKSDFTWQVSGDNFIQAGTFTRPDGKTIKVDELLFVRIKTPHAYQKNPSIGTWNQLSSVYTDYDGNRYEHTQETRTRVHIITPTHWMRFNTKDGKFESAMMGTYTMADGKVYPKLQYASFPLEESAYVVMTEHVKNNMLYVSGTMTSADGRKFVWDDIFERVK